MRINQFIYVAGLALTVAACSSDDATQASAPQSERVPVTLSYTAEAQVDTRAAAQTNLNQSNIVSGKQVKVRISVHGSDDWSNYDYTTGDGGTLTLPSPAPYYPLNGSSIDIKAYYPADAGTTFTVSNDQTSDDAYAASDLMWAEPVTDQARTTGTVALTFTHKMAKIVVNAEAGTAISQINSVTLKQVKPTVSFAIGSGVVGTASGSDTEVKVVKDETAASVTGAAVIPEQTITGALLEVGVTKTDGSTGTATYSVPAGKTFAANHVYTLDLTVSYPEVGATTAINGWTEGGTAIVQPSVVQQTFDVESNGIMTFNVKGVQFQMIAVKGGSYETFGGVTVTGTLSDYYIGQTEVTQGLWTAVMGSNPSRSMTGDSYPVDHIRYNDICGGGDVAVADCFLTRLNQAVASQLPSGKQFKLPTDAQWEYAARGGTAKKDYTYAGSSELSDVGWWGNNGSSYVAGNSDAHTHPVAMKQANSLGLYDMSGNVWEICKDWYQATGDLPTAHGTDYENTTKGSDRVFRGGSWSSDPGACAVARRTHDTPSYRSARYGFRLVLQ